MSGKESSTFKPEVADAPEAEVGKDVADVELIKVVPGLPSLASIPQGSIQVEEEGNGFYNTLGIWDPCKVL